MRRPTLAPLTLTVLALGLSALPPAHAQSTGSPLEFLHRILPPGAKPPPADTPARTPAPPPAPEAAAMPPAAPGAATAEPSPAGGPAPTAPGADPGLPAAAPTAGAGVAPVTLGCRPLTDQAMAADLKAATAQQQKADLTEQARLFDAAVALWAQTVAQCEGRAKERAQRNLSDNIKARAALQEQLGSDPQCASAQKNATSLQDLARQAFGERRWGEAAMLYRKAEDQWDVAGERCSGSAQEVAQRRRDQAGIDAHNAEFCAPVYDRAREVTQRTRTLAPGMSREEKQEALQLSETLWRDATSVCRGQAFDTARSSAQAVARERGTPWAETRQALSLGQLGNPSLSALAAPTPRPPPAGSAEASAGTAPAGAPGTLGATAATAATALAGAAQTGSAATAAAATVGAPAATTAATAAAAATTAVPGAALPVASAALAPAAPAAAVGRGAATPAVAAATLGTAAATVPGRVMPAEFTAGTTRFTGQFSMDAGGSTYSGTGRILWANGDVYDGTLVRGLKHGQGRFVWANGQRYDGDWFQDKPNGKASVQFANGNVYNGTVIDGTPNGQGRMVYTGGDIYVGEFKNGYPEGRGTQTWPNGQRYEGQWHQQQPHGQGRMQFASGEVYAGQFVNGLPDGEGSFNWPNGDQYTGAWKAGKKHGQGVFTWKNGDRWEGLYDNDQQTAQGRHIPKATP